MIYYTIDDEATEKSDLRKARSLGYFEYYNTDDIAGILFHRYVKKECDGIYPIGCTDIFIYDKKANGTIVLSSVHRFSVQTAIFDVTDEYDKQIITD